MSFEPHYVNSWIIYCIILYIIGILGFLIKDLIYPYYDNEDFSTMEPFVRKRKKNQGLKTKKDK